MPRKTKEPNDEKEIKKNTSSKEVLIKEKKETSNKSKITSSTAKKSNMASKLDKKVELTSDKDNNSNNNKKNNRKTSVASKKKSTTTANQKSKKADGLKKSVKSKKETNLKATKKSASSKKDVYTNNEYYDLPYRYNQTVVKVLAQTPNNLFIYWDISDSDRENLKKQFGENFFETTYPVLIVYNDTLNYHFEVSINDFANSWYLHVNDSKSNYMIELGRRPIDFYKFNNTIKKISGNDFNNIDYIPITTSNNIESPNDKILFNKEQKMVYYKNIKTNVVKSQPITSLTFMHNMGKIYNIYELYKHFYNEENIEDIYDLSNPSSGNPSSNSPSSSSFRH